MRGRSSPVIEPIAPRRRSLAAAPENAHPTIRVPNSSGRDSARARIAIDPMLCPTTRTGRSGATASSTAPRSFPKAAGVRSPAAARPLRPCERRSNTTQRYLAESSVHW